MTFPCKLNLVYLITHMTTALGRIINISNPCPHSWFSSQPISTCFSASLSHFSKWKSHPLSRSRWALPWTLLSPLPTKSNPPVSPINPLSKTYPDMILSDPISPTCESDLLSRTRSTAWSKTAGIWSTWCLWKLFGHLGFHEKFYPFLPGEGRHQSHVKHVLREPLLSRVVPINSMPR